MIRGHYATFASAVHGFGSAATLARIRRKFREANPADASPPPTFGPRLPRRGLLFAPPAALKGLAAWATPFMGADASVVRRTMRLEYGGLEAARRGSIAAASGSAAAADVPFQFSVSATIATTWGAFLVWSLLSCPTMCLAG